MINKREVLGDVKGLLEYAKTLGMNDVNIIKYRKSESPKSANDGRWSIVDGHGTVIKKLSKKIQALVAVRADVGDCTRCRLCQKRKNIVFGAGNPDAHLMFIGEGPGADEDEQGMPFVGRAGQLLTKVINAMGLTRDDVYISNVVKCRPPNNRNPLPDEVATCIPFLKQQAKIIVPKAIVCLGSVATQNLLGTEEKITRIRGHFTKWQDIPVMPTYHPAFLLRNPNMKKPVWEDMMVVMKFLGLPITAKKK